jgi:hypothetical protein
MTNKAPPPLHRAIAGFFPLHMAKILKGIVRIFSSSKHIRQIILNNHSAKYDPQLNAFQYLLKQKYYHFSLNIIFYHCSQFDYIMTLCALWIQLQSPIIIIQSLIKITQHKMSITQIIKRWCISIIQLYCLIYNEELLS